MYWEFKCFSNAGTHKQLSYNTISVCSYNIYCIPHVGLTKVVVRGNPANLTVLDLSK